MLRESRIHLFPVVAIILSCLLLPLTVLGAETVIYSDGFEADDGGYTSDGTANWAWGDPYNPAGPTGANSGQKCWGTRAQTTVTGTLEGNIYSPSLNIPALTTGQVARVRFYAYVDIYSEGIRGAEGDFYLSADGKQTWKLLGRLYDKMAGGWQRYQFDLSEYSGKTVNLRFRAFMLYSKPGFFIDDVAVTVEDVSEPAKLLTLEANEDASAVASCPWVYTWDGKEFVQDNDIYSVARNPQGEMRDFYLLQKPLVAHGGQYSLEIREVESEDSWTDFIGLLAVDHHPEVTAAPDDKGNVLAYRPAELVKPVSAVSNAGSDVLMQVGDRDSSGFHAYSSDYVELDFGKVDVSAGARVLLRVKGFLAGEGLPKPFTGPPAIIVQARNTSGVWQEVGRLNPRFEWSEGVFDLSRNLPDPEGNITIRLLSISHDSKYHEIDYVALASGPQPKVTVNVLPLQAADFGGSDALYRLRFADNAYVQMGSGNKFRVSFAELPLHRGEIRDFILVSEGYYVPHNDTFFIYTWDGMQWAQQDSYSFAATDSERKFDLSTVLPDPVGEYKLRIWQDYSNFPAAIDLVKLQVGTQTGNLSTATDLRNGSNIISLVNASDDTRFEYPLNSVTKQPFNRWTEFRWSGLAANVPPNIPAGSLSVQGNTISWTYYDAEGSSQSAFDMQVWTGPGATGTCIWSPPTVRSTASSALYGGPPLSSGRTYYVRVRLNDGISWGGWADAAFIPNVSSEFSTITFVSAGQGTIIDTTSQTENHGGSASSVSVLMSANRSFTITPDSGYAIAAIIVDGMDRGNVTSYTFTNVIADHYINAYFEALPVTSAATIIAAAGPKGTISPAGAITVAIGSNQAYTITPKGGFTVAALVVDGTVLPGAQEYTFSNVTADHYINAYFKPITAAITAAAGPSGTIAPSGAITVANGSSQTYTITPNAGYEVAALVVDGTVLPGARVYVFSNVAADHYINAYFEPITVIITAAAGPSGTITPAGPVPVASGGNQTYSITPDDGFAVAAIVVDGAVLPGTTSYTFTNVTADHYINAYFQ